MQIRVTLRAGVTFVALVLAAGCGSAASKTAGSPPTPNSTAPTGGTSTAPAPRTTAAAGTTAPADTTALSASTTRETATSTSSTVASSSTASTQTTSTPPTTTPAVSTTGPLDAAQQALQSLTASMNGVFATSQVQITPAGTFVAISHNISQGSGGEDGVVDIYSYLAGAWQDQATLGGSDGLDVVLPGAATPITVAQFTGGSIPDFFATFAGADHTSAVIAADVKGTWQLLGVQGQSSPVLTNATLIDPTLISQSVDNCTPTCASGTITDTTYRFDAAVGELVPTGPSTTEN